MSPYQPQQQVYPYLNQIAYRAPAPLALPPPRPTPLLSPAVQQYTPVAAAAAPQPTRYYNPLDPLGLFNNPLVTAVITNQCPGHELETAFNCATAMADHSECCIRNGIGSYNGGRCMVFCTTHLGNPGNTLQYIDCLQVFGRIKNCYREYHLTHPNLFGDF
ncbi:unnamed protein product [Gongylonema pulchrum]|uniref:Domain of unknown function DB domain-containing protein n=1 Tax=Gongylonema pulchrum TaxID=637853 RepID=A0A3P7QUY0_9BILA|nr:unnamed protein product [Gongylonema pulchrum]